ncbi:hypothetical protein [Saccharothrix algeriensis]|uniref:Lipocalin-like domain-containing protein n=2 Tax=Saccharothrix algeriensis TaxID=173560 RepID=A0ABS2SAQ9_9PSEU|nr:hypothetical protein [Saccharothrix algeriensis]MBM7813049.1 hypothetical protein [Saccharothrix algeriensis]
MREELEPFLGEWVLDPTRSAYSGGVPPEEGRYGLRVEGDELVAVIEGVRGTGEAVHVEYRLSLTGDTRLSDGPFDRVRLLVEPNALGTVVFDGDAEAARAWRILGAPDEMTIVQSAPDVEGVWRDDVSVYRRV